MSSRAPVRLAVLLVLGVIAAGCFGGGGSRGKAADVYEGEFKEFDLYLWPLSVSCPTQSTDSRECTGGWEVYPGARVDAWAWSLENDKSQATIPGPTLRAREHDTVRVNFYIVGGTPMSHTIHWHGIHLPWDQDGVPYVSQPPIGQTALGGNGESVWSYEFTVNQSGTYWYHCHVDTAHHLDMGMYGALIVDPADPNADPAYTQEATLLFDEWDKSHAHANTAAIQNAVGKSNDPAVTANDVYGYIRDYLIMNQAFNDTSGQAGARQIRDWYPITYAPYFAEYDTFMINGKSFPNTDVIEVASGDVLRLRLINAGSEVHAIHLHGHHMLVTHKDGYAVPALHRLGDASDVDTFDELWGYAQPEDTILIAPGERYDAYVYLDNPGPWMLHDHISLNEANDFIAPGGMMTMLCYTDGWPGANNCGLGHTALHGMAGGISDSALPPSTGTQVPTAPHAHPTEVSEGVTSVAPTSKEIPVPDLP